MQDTKSEGTLGAQPIAVTRVSGNEAISGSEEVASWKQVGFYAGGPIQASGDHRRLIDRDGKVWFTYEDKPDEVREPSGK